MYGSVFFFKQKTAYEMRISDWSSDVCSSDLSGVRGGRRQTTIPYNRAAPAGGKPGTGETGKRGWRRARRLCGAAISTGRSSRPWRWRCWPVPLPASRRLIFCAGRSEEHTSELQSLMRISYAVFCLKKKKKNTTKTVHHVNQKNH